MSAEIQCGHSHHECEAVRAENKRLQDLVAEFRKRDESAGRAVRLALAERDALAAQVEKVRALADTLIPQTPTFHAVVAGKHSDACIACLILAHLPQEEQQ